MGLKTKWRQKLIRTMNKPIALREVAAEAGLEHAARGALGGGVATRGVEAGDDFEHVGGELVERDHGSYGDGSPTVVAMVMATRLW